MAICWGAASPSNMALHTLDILVLLGVAISAGLGAWRGFVTEVLSLFAWGLVVFAL